MTARSDPPPESRDSMGLTGALTDLVSEHGHDETVIADPRRLVGDVISIDYTTADVLVHDQARQLVGGVQQGCLLVAVRLGAGLDPDPETPLLLLRVLRSSPLPNDLETNRARFDAAQRVAESNNNWDDRDVTDLFTLNMMRYTGIHCRILGIYKKPEDTKSSWTFSSDLDNFYAGRGLKVYKPFGKTLEKLLHASIRSGSDGYGSATKIGQIRYATSIPRDGSSVFVRASDFTAQRTALFGMTRTGKSNTVKIIARAVFELRKPDDGLRVGQIIFDPNGEYANANPQDQGCLRNLANLPWVDEDDIVTYGLHEHPYDPKRRITKLNFYGNREPVAHPGDDDASVLLSSLVQGKAMLNERLADERAGYIRPFVTLGLEPPSMADGMSEWLRYRRALFIYRAILTEAGYAPPPYLPQTRGLFNQDLRSLMADDEEMVRFADRLNFQPFGSWDLAGDFARSLSNFVKRRVFTNYDNEYAQDRDDGRKWSDSTLLDLLKFFSNTRGVNVLSAAREWHDPASSDNFTEEIVDLVQKGRLIIIDQSIGTPDMNEAAATDVMRAVFSAQQRAFTNPVKDDQGELTEPPDVLIFLEEAHTLLPHDGDDMRSIWVRTAKEGAKFHIGLVYSTQEPSSIQSNILKNTENWFIAHLNNTDETRQLSKFNDFGDFTDSFINVNELGYLKMRTRSNRFTLPVQVDLFEAPPSEGA